MPFNTNIDLCEKNNLQKFISYICKNKYKFFLSKENVQGVGCGYKVIGGFKTKYLCIQVFVKKKVSSLKLSYTNIIPPSFNGILTDVIETGVFTSYSLTEKIRPFKGGYGISSITITPTNTAGCLAGNKKLKFILGTNHGLVNYNRLPIRYPIIQPPYEYGGYESEDTVATVYKFMPLRFINGTSQPINLSDCALGLLKETNIMSSQIAFIGKLKCVRNPSLNIKVRKVGAITELTEGTITSVDATITLSYPNNLQCLFKNQMLTTSMAEPGDSGAIIVDENDCGLGLLIGGSQNNCVASYLKIVCDQLDVKVVD